MIFKSKQADVVLPTTDLATVVLSRANELSSKPALIDGTTGHTLTFGELAKKVDQMAAGLDQRGFKKGDVFAIFCPNLPEYAIAFLAVAKVGGINTTVNSLYSTEDLVHQFNDSGAKFLLTIPAFLDRALPAAKTCGIEEVFVIGDAENTTPFEQLLLIDRKVPEVKIDSSKDLVALPYSSGTTGLSKGVMLTHQNLIANMILSHEQNPIDETDNILGVLPFFHIYGMVLILNLSIYRGATLVTMPRFDLEQFLNIAQDYQLTFLNLVPPLVLALAKHPLVDNFDLSSVRVIGCGAAPLGEELEKACAKRVACRVFQGYGLTEVAGASHISPSSAPASKSGSVGPVLPNTQAKIVDSETGAELGINERGEVCLYGPHVMTGYLNNIEATNHTIDKEGWFHTGDIGYADEDGYFYIVDRVKELIKYKGYQVAPAELEALLLSHPSIDDAAVIPSPDEEAGEVPKAFVVLKEPMTEAQIMAWVAEKVAPHKKIRRLEFVQEIPKSASGKILRRILVEQERAN